jgi:hypothetical protein
VFVSAARHQNALSLGKFKDRHPWLVRPVHGWRHPRARLESASHRFATDSASKAGWYEPFQGGFAYAPKHR